MSSHKKTIVHSGKRIDEAKKALIMIHGRGASSEDILSVSPYLNVKEFALLAPQATNYTWYPYSFLAPVAQNEPWLTSALSLLDEIVNDLAKAGLNSENIYFLGFSQGACLTLEYVTRNAKSWGGVAAFTGGLIGDRVDNAIYKGNFDGTPVFIGSADPDPHVPVDRVNESAQILNSFGAKVTKKIYPGIGHTITKDELDEANKLIFR